MEDFLAPLREKAIYFKLTSKSVGGGAVSVDDVLTVLKSISESYNSFINAEYGKVNDQQDPKKLKTLLSGLKNDNKLMIVDLKFESYGMSVTPDFLTIQTQIPKIENQLLWKESTFQLYKDIVLESDYTDENYLNEINHRYTPKQKKDIFKPIFDGIINNTSANTHIQTSREKKLKTLKRVGDHTYSSLVPNLQKETKAAEPSKKSLAMVELSGSSNNRAKVVELFDDVSNPTYSYYEIIGPDTSLRLKFPFYCELIHENEAYCFENKSLGIYGYGETIEEARLDLFEEFIHSYQRYNSLNEDELSEDVLQIKEHLNHLVKK
jgi:hypothetical protein